MPRAKAKKKLNSTKTTQKSVTSEAHRRRGDKKLDIVATEESIENVSPTRLNQQIPLNAAKIQSSISVNMAAKKKLINLSGDYLKSSSSSTELAKRIKEVHEELQSIPNQQKLVELESLAKELISDKIVESKDKNVRLMGACCLVDILRIFAPEAPYTNYDLQEIFKLIISQLRGIGIGHQSEGSDALYFRYFYLLESLATVKSCILLVSLEGSDSASEENLLTELFSCLFASIRDDHSVKIESHMLAIMQACIEESEYISPVLMDVILEHLLPNNRRSMGEGAAATTNTTTTTTTAATGAASYRLAQQLISLTSDQMQGHLSHFFNNILVEGQTSTSELSEHVYTLIYEIHKIHSSLLLHVLPNVCMQLQVDDLQTRHQAVALMGRLFASSHADYGSQYMKNFKDFLGRFKDKNRDIRLQMIQIGAIILHRKKDLAEAIRKELCDRLSDPDGDVRRRAVNEICDVAATDLEAMDKKTLLALGERMKDKKVILRKEAMTGLAQIFACQISDAWSVHRVVSKDTLLKLNWIPDYVLKCYAYPIQELQLRVVQLVSDILLPKKTSEEVRMRGLSCLLTWLDSSSVEALRRILLEQRHCQSIVANYLHARRKSRDENSSLSSTSSSLSSHSLSSSSSCHRNQSPPQMHGIHRMDPYLTSLAELLPETDGKMKLVTQLDQWKDQKVFAYLHILCHPLSGTEELKEARDALVKALGTKTPLGEFAKNLCRKMTMSIVNANSLPALFDIVQEAMQANDLRTAKATLGLLQTLGSIFPDLLHDSVDRLHQILLSTSSTSTSLTKSNKNDSDIRALSLKILAQLVSQSTSSSTKEGTLVMKKNSRLSKHETNKGDEKPQTLSSNASLNAPLVVQSTLQTLCLTGSYHESKNSLVCYGGMLGEGPLRLLLVDELMIPKRLSLGNADVCSVLQSLATAFKCFPQAVSLTHREKVWHILWKDFLDLDAQPMTKGGDKRGKDGARLRYPTTFKAEQFFGPLQGVIKCAVNLMLHVPLPAWEGLNGKQAKQFVGRKMIDRLLDILHANDHALLSAARAIPSASTAAKSTAAAAGAAAAGAASSSSLLEMAANRKSAACGLLKLARDVDYESLLLVREWHQVGYVLQDDDMGVRRGVLKTLRTGLLKHNLQHKYLSYLVLCATDGDALLKKEAKQTLMLGIARMRKVHEARSLTAKHDTTLILLVPEYILPYVIHLLAHHPSINSSNISSSSSNISSNSSSNSTHQRNSGAFLSKGTFFPSFPSSQESTASSSALPSSLKATFYIYLSFMIDALVYQGAAAMEADNIAFLLQILEMMQSCQDVLGSSAMDALIPWCSDLLKKKIKSQHNLKQYPGKLFLPKHLYRMGRSPPPPPPPVSKANVSLSKEALSSPNKKIHAIQTLTKRKSYSNLSSSEEEEEGLGSLKDKKVKISSEAVPKKQVVKACDVSRNNGCDGSIHDEASIMDEEESTSATPAESTTSVSTSSLLALSTSRPRSNRKTFSQSTEDVASHRSSSPSQDDDGSASIPDSELSSSVASNVEAMTSRPPLRRSTRRKSASK